MLPASHELWVKEHANGLGDRSRAGTLCEFAAHMGGTGLPPSVAGEGLLLRGRVEAAHGRWGTAKAAFDAALRIFQRLGGARVADASLELVSELDRELFR